MNGEFAYGTISSICSYALFYPIETIKTQFQVTRFNEKMPHIRKLIHNLYTQRGAIGFYRGLIPLCATKPIFWGVFFTTKDYMVYEPTKIKYVDKLITNFGSATVSSTILNPLFVMKTRLQTENLRFQRIGYFKLIHHIYKNEGCKGFMKGAPITYLNNFKLGVQFPIYDHFIETNYFRNNMHNICFSAAASRMISSAIFYPFDLIRVVQRSSEKKISIKNAANKIFKMRGIMGFYKGVGLYSITSTPTFVAMMIIKDIMIKNKSHFF